MTEQFNKKGRQFKRNKAKYKINKYLVLSLMLFIWLITFIIILID